MDWPQVALVAVVGAIAIAAIVALDLDAEKIAAVPLSEWTIIASAVTGVVGTIAAAMRGRAVERLPSTVRREAETIPPEAP